MPENIFQTAAVIGMGMIGSSLAAAFESRSCLNRILGYDTCKDTVAGAEEADFIDESYHSAGTGYPGLAEADLIIISTPVRQIPEVLAEIYDSLKEEAVIIDTGSCKAFIMEKADRILKSRPDLHFFGGHPIAGSEKCGISSCDPGIFAGADFILTPLHDHSRQGDPARKVVNILEELGFNVRFMGAGEHDRKLALISHLPQVVAYALAGTLQEKEDLHELLDIAGDGLFDTTRIAASDPGLWRDITMSNRREILNALDCFQSSIEKIKSALEKEDPEKLEELFAGSARVRRELGEIRRENDV